MSAVAMARAKVNPALVIVSNPPETPAHAWRNVRDVADELEQLAKEISEPAVRTKVDAIARHLTHLAKRMAFVGDRHRTSPRGTPRQNAGEKFSDHVLGVIYVHRDDNGFYVHGFGDANLDLKERGDNLTITGLKEYTGVAMVAMPNGSVTLRGTRGQNLWDDL